MQTPVVLCIDYDLDGLIGREALLKQNGYNVLISTSPREGLRLFSSCHLDAVILDYAMPEMCGDVLASRMKHLKPDVPLMLLSADDRLGEEALEQVDMFLSKREPPRKFIGAVEDLLVRSEECFSKWLRDCKGKMAGVAVDPDKWIYTHTLCRFSGERVGRHTMSRAGHHGPAHPLLRSTSTSTGCL